MCRRRGELYAYTGGLNSAPYHAEYTPLLMLLLLLPILLLLYRTTLIYIGCISWKFSPQYIAEEVVS